MKKIVLLMVFAVVTFSILCVVTTSQADEKMGVTDNEVLIGGIGPITGPASFLGIPIDLAGNLFFKQVNEAGGIHGRKIKFVMGDDACGASQGLAIFKKLVSSDKVFAMAGVACSHVGEAIKPLVNKEEIPLIISVALSPKLLIPHSKYIFRLGPPSDFTGAIMAKFMREYFPDKFTKVAIIHTQEEYGTTGRDGILSELKKYGIQPLAVETHKIGDTDYSGQLLKIKPLNPEVLFLFNYQRDMALITKQAYELGINCVKIGCFTDIGMLADMVGKEALKNLYPSTMCVDTIKGPRLKSFVDMYKKELPDYMKNPNNPNTADVTAYVGFMTMAEGLKRAGRDLTRTKFIDALDSIDDMKTPWISQVTFSKTNHEGLRGQRFYRFVDLTPVIIERDFKME